MRNLSLRFIKCVIGLSVALIAVSNCFNVLSNSPTLAPLPTGDTNQRAAATTSQINPSFSVPGSADNGLFLRDRETVIGARAELATRASAFSPFAPNITATKSHTPPGSANPGDTLTYTIVITNSGTTDATDVSFADTIDPNTTLVPGSVKASPIAVDDSYHTIGNVNISVPAGQGVTANDSNSGTGTLSVTKVNAAVVPPAGSATTSTANGSVTMNSDGSFTYTPNVAFRGPSDSFTYTLDNGTGSTDTATVTISVNGLIWFVNVAAAPGDGRLGTPFNCLVGAGCFDPAAADIANDNIFVYTGAYTGGLTLLSGQKLIGQGAGDTLLNITGLTAPSGTNLLPSTGGTNPTIAAAGANITLGSGNTVRGVTLNGTAAAAVDLTGTGFGTVTIAETSLGGLGQALNLNNGTLSGPVASTAAFSSISSTSSATTGVSLTSVGGNMSSSSTSVTNPATIGLQIQSAQAGASLAFGSTTVSGSAGTGVRLIDNVGNVTFADLSITPVANQRAFHATNAVSNSGTITTTGGTISTSGAVAVEVSRTSAGTIPLVISLTSVSVSGGPNGIVLNNTSGSFGVTGNGSTANSGGIIQNTTGNAVTLTGASGVSLKFMRLLQPGANSAANVGASGILATNLSGTNLVEKSTIEYGTTAIPNSFALRLANTSTNATLTLEATTIQNKADGTAAVSLSAMGNSQITFNVQDSNTGDSFDSKYTNLFGSGLSVGAGDDAGSTAKVFLNVSNSKFVNAPSNGINNLEMTVQQSATLVPNVSNNTFDKVGLPLAVVGVINVNTTGSGRLGDNSNNALFSGNSITNIRSGAGPAFAYDPVGNNGYFAMRFAPDNNVGGVNHKIKIVNNQITEVARTGLLISTRNLANDVNVQLEGNTIGTLANPVGYANVRGVSLETQTNSLLKINILNNPSIVTRSSSGTNSSLHLRSGIDNSSTAAIQATIVGNTIKNAGTAVTPGRFRAQTLGVADGLTGAAGSICLDLRNNNLEDGTKLFELIHNSAGTFNLNQSGNTGTITTTGTIGSVASCTLPGTLSAPAEEFVIESIGIPGDTVSDDGTASNGVPRLSQRELDWMVQAAIVRMTELDISPEDITRLQAITFEIGDLRGGRITATTSSGVRIDETAAGHGWFFDQTPSEDSEFQVAVQNKHYEAVDSSPAYGRLDLLTVVMRELGRVYLEGKDRVPKKLRPLMALPLSPSVRCMPVFKFLDRSTSSAGADHGQNGKAASALSKTDSPSPFQLRPAVFNTTADLMPGSYGRSARRMSYATSARRESAPAPAMFSGETVNLNIGTIPPGESVTIMFQVTIDSPFPNGVCTVTNQGQVTGSNFSQVDTNSDVVTMVASVAIGACPANIMTNTDPGQCTAVVTYTTPTASGCPAATVTCVPGSGSAFPKGMTTVTCTATNGTPPDSACSFTVTVKDAQAPTCNLPAPLVQNNDPGQCSAVVTYTATASDNCPGATIVCIPASGSTFPKGTTTVNCTASDTSPDSPDTNCSFTVTVNDNEPPTIGACPAPITTNTASGLCSATVSYATPTASDNCPGVTVVCSPASGTTFSKGTTTVTCTATDAVNLTASCSFTVTVNDNQPPSISCPSNVNATENPPGSGCATVTYTTPTPTDNCPGATTNCSPASGFCFPIGSTTVTCTATDTSSNTASCTFQVNVVVACTITCPPNITTNNTPGQCGAAVNYAAPATTAGCGTVTCTPPSGSFFPKGTTPVSCSTTAGPGCSFSVTVVDNQPPTIVCPANVIATAPTGQTSTVVGYPAPTVSDNCPGATFVCAPASGSSFPLGSTTVNCTATDTSGNHASCSFKVLVGGAFLVNADSFLRDGADNTNEGGNELLRIQSSGHNRVVVRFDMTGIPTAGLQSASLVLNITDNSDNWGATGRLVDAHRLLAEWTEGNGHTVGSQPNFRGTGEGVTWNCAKDSNIANQNDDCLSQWNGGIFAAATASPVLHTNGQLGDVSWNVTTDVIAGANNGWIIKKQTEGQAGQVKYYSKEGAAAAGNPNLGPRLVLVYQ